MKKLTPEQLADLKLKKQRFNIMAGCRRYLARKRFDEAYIYAVTRGLSVEECRYHSWDRGESLPLPPPTWRPPLEIPIRLERNLQIVGEFGPMALKCPLPAFVPEVGTRPLPPAVLKKREAELHTAMAPILKPVLQELAKLPSAILSPEQVQPALDEAIKIRAARTQLPPTPSLAPTLEPDTVLKEPTLTQTINGWPTLTEAEVWQQCRNRKLLLIRLPDGRMATMWRDDRRNWRLGSRIIARLVEWSADPIYEQVIGQNPPTDARPDSVPAVATEPVAEPVPEPTIAVTAPGNGKLPEPGTFPERIADEPKPADFDDFA